MKAEIFVPIGGPPSTPGEILLEEFLKPMGITAKQFALHVHMTPAAISEIIHGRRGITPVSALKFSRALGTTEQFWLNIQFSNDLYELRNSKEAKKIARSISRIEPHVYAS